MARDAKVRLFDLVTCVGEVVDLISPRVADHHNKVTYIAYRLGRQLGLPVGDQNELVLAGALHDIGALSLRERLDALQFEARFEQGGGWPHAEKGYSLLKMFEPFANVADIVRFHHVYWNGGRGSESEGKEVPRASHILHLADRIAVLVDKDREALGQARKIRERVTGSSGAMFPPEAVDAFVDLSSKEYFWLDIAYLSTERGLSRTANLPRIELDMEKTLGLAELFSHIIDFRSNFTAAPEPPAKTSTKVQFSNPFLAMMSMNRLVYFVFPPGYRNGVRVAGMCCSPCGQQPLM